MDVLKYRASHSGGRYLENAMTNNVPNLDTMDCDELLLFYLQYSEGGNYLDLFPLDATLTGKAKTAYTNASKAAAATLAQCAINSAAMLRMHAKGQADKAKMYNDRAKEYYATLPEWAHWAVAT